jgi:hypothetical protein
MNELMKPLVAAAIPLLTALGSFIATGTLNAPELSLAITGFVTALVVVLAGLIWPNQEAGVLA